MDDIRREILSKTAVGVINSDGTYDFFTPEENLDLKIKQSNNLKKLKQREYSNREEVKKKRKMYSENDEYQEMRKLYLNDDETKKKARRRAKIRKVQEKVMKDFFDVTGLEKILKMNIDYAEYGVEPEESDKEEALKIIETLINVDPNVLAENLVKSVFNTWDK